MKKTSLIVMPILACIILCGCAQNISPNTYTTGEVGVVGKVKKGVIISRRNIIIDNKSGIGGLAGMGSGAAIGSMAGRDHTAVGVAGAVGGAVVAGVIGNEIDKAVNRHEGYEYIIKLDEGQMISVVQEKSVQLAVKQRVLIIYGTMTRIVPDETIFSILTKK